MVADDTTCVCWCFSTKKSTKVERTLDAGQSTASPLLANAAVIFEREKAGVESKARRVRRTCCFVTRRAMASWSCCARGGMVARIAWGARVRATGTQWENKKRGLDDAITRPANRERPCADSCANRVERVRAESPAVSGQVCAFTLTCGRVQLKTN